MSVLCVGELLIDFFSKEDTVLGHEATYLHNPGGAPANVAAMCAKLGEKSAFMGAVGDDAYGNQLRGVLEAYAIDTLFLQQLKGLETTKAFVTLQSDGERDFTFKRGADEAFEWQNNEMLALADYQLFHFGSATAFMGGRLEDSYNALYEAGVKEGKFISFDPNYREALYGQEQSAWKRKSLHYVKQADFVKVSEEELYLMTEQDLVIGAKTLIELGAGIVAVTLGKSGVYVATEQYSARIPSIAIEAVDATGAGDAFVGAFLYQVSRRGLLHGARIEPELLNEISAFAAVAGALNCLNKGAMSALPSLEVIQSYSKLFRIEGGSSHVDKRNLRARL